MAFRKFAAYIQTVIFLFGYLVDANSDFIVADGWAHGARRYCVLIAN